MTVAEIINKYKRQNEDDINMEELIEWVETLDRLIYEEIIMTHEGFEKYLPTSEDDTEDYFADYGLLSEVIADMPYHNIYIYYIDMRWYQLNKETNNYNAAVTMFEDAYRTYANYYNRHHKPLQTQAKWTHHQLFRR